LIRNVRALPRCKAPVGLGASRVFLTWSLKINSPLRGSIEPYTSGFLRSAPCRNSLMSRLNRL
jgi:hypothetical protein